MKLRSMPRVWSLISTGCLVGMGWLCSSSAFAGAPASEAYGVGSGAYLVQVCREEQSGQNLPGPGFCQGYLHGYIEAHPEIVFSDDLPSEFMQRVLRTKSPGWSRRPSHP